MPISKQLIVGLVVDTYHADNLSIDERDSENKIRRARTKTEASQLGIKT